MRKPALQFPLVWAVYMLFWVCGALAAVWPAPGLTAACLLFGADRRLWKLPRASAATLIFISAFAYGDWRIAAYEDAIKNAPAWAKNHPGKKTIRISAQIISVQALPANTLRITLGQIRPSDASGTDADGEKDNNHNMAMLTGACLWKWANPPPNVHPLPGQTVEISRPVRPVHYMANGPARYSEAAMASRGIYWRMWSQGEKGDPAIVGKPYFLAAIRDSLRKKYIQAMLPDREAPESSANTALSPGHAVLLALIFGDRTALSQDAMDNFAAATLAHSLALSGQHLCVAGFLGFLLVISVARLTPSVYLRRPKIILISLASIPFAAIYLWLGAGPPSLLRAFCILFIAALWLWRGLVFNALDLLCAALCAILVFNPLAILDAGLQLSALCIAVIALALPPLSRLSFRAHDRQISISRKFAVRGAQILAISLLIQLALLPIGLLRFQLAGFWFPLNVIWLPILGVFILPLAALGLILAAMSPFVGFGPASLVLDLAAMPCGMLVKHLSSLRDLGFLAEPAFLLPHWANLLAFATLACALAWFFSSPTGKKAKCARLLCLALVLLSLPPALRLHSALNQDIEIETLDVGQGQAIAVNLPGAMRLLLDGGGFAGSAFDVGKRIVGPYLSMNRTPRLAAVFNSHPDYDHTGGLFHILANFRPNKVFHNGRDAAKNIRVKWQEILAAHGAIPLKSGDRIILGNPENRIWLEVLHPQTGTGWLGNDASLVMRLCRKGVGIALFTGDAEKTSLGHIARNTEDMRAKILFLPHHGSGGSFSPGFFRAVSPQIAIASCGFQNRWNYPAEKILNFFAKRDIPVLDTGTSGKISINVDENGEIKVKTAR